MNEKREPRLTETVHGAGWACKLGPGDLAQALTGLKFQSDPRIISGLEQAEDAGVYKLTEDLAIIQTVDFFTPIVDDPYDFGRIAAANSLSDVYAMGGRPLTALNVVCFPQSTMKISLLHDVLRGGLDIMREAEVLLIGGHTVDDPELKYGLAVTGTIHPAKIVHARGARDGDRLILTKPLGTGIISTAIKADIASQQSISTVIESMTTLNRRASELMLEVGVNACKDITGFGLLGHAAEMVAGTDMGFVIEAAAVPVFPEAKELAEKGMMPGGLHRNREFRQNMVTFDEKVPQYLQDILFDPQTSGGLLMAVPEKKAARLLERLHKEGVKAAAIIGEVKKELNGRIRVG